MVPSMTRDTNLGSRYRVNVVREVRDKRINFNDTYVRRRLRPKFEGTEEFDSKCKCETPTILPSAIKNFIYYIKYLEFNILNICVIF